MICNRSIGAGDVTAHDVFRFATMPPRMSGGAQPDAPVKPDPRPTAPPPQEDPRYPTHTPPTPDKMPSHPCPGPDDPDEEFPACRG